MVNGRVIWLMSVPENKWDFPRLWLLWRFGTNRPCLINRSTEQVFAVLSVIVRLFFSEAIHFFGFGFRGGIIGEISIVFFFGFCAFFWLLTKMADCRKRSISKSSEKEGVALLIRPAGFGVSFFLLNRRHSLAEKSAISTPTEPDNLLFKSLESKSFKAQKKRSDCFLFILNLFPLLRYF